MLLFYGSWKFFFSAVLPAQNSPEVNFYLINSPMHSSVLKSVLGQGVPLRFQWDVLSRSWVGLYDVRLLYVGCLGFAGKDGLTDH